MPTNEGASRSEAGSGPSAPPAKRKRAATAGAKDASASAPSQPLTRPLAKPCLRCLALPASGKRWYYTKRNGVDPLDNKCYDCYSTFVAPWEHSHSWLSLCTSCDADPELAARFMATVLVHGGEIPGWTQSEVDKHSSHSLTISRNLVGLNMDEFKTLYGGYKPEDLGFKSAELPSFTGKNFRGVLLQDSSMPGVRGQYSRMVQVDKVEPAMTFKNHCYPDQADEAFEKTCTDEEGSNVLYAKMRTCTLTHVAVLESLAKVAPETSSAAASGSRGASASCSAQPAVQATSGGDDDDEDDDEEEAEAVGPSRPGLAPDVLACLQAGTDKASMPARSVSGTPTGKARSTMESPGTNKKNETPQATSVPLWQWGLVRGPSTCFERRSVFRLGVEIKMA